ncbi:MAG TPA: SUF system Fe-S cluster assembly regulator [Planctomycetota bacterium]|jgi:FeS assembly SUF system regulator|nr:SUF system Fe-S cluster assembly regulator [Planctomycetota bacterium]
MIRLSRQSDYGVLLLGLFAKAPRGTILSCRDLVEQSHLAAPMVAKVLKLLTRGGILKSVRGIHGGYSLTRSPEQISVGCIIEALEGPVSVTDCAPRESQHLCAQERWCPVKSSWRRLNDAIFLALNRVTLAEMTCPVGDPVGAFNGQSATR